MADQVAVALDNARLFEAREEAMEAERRAHGALQRKDWNRLLRERMGLGFRSDPRGISSAKDIWRPAMDQAQKTGSTVHIASPTKQPSPGTGRLVLAVPIKIRDEVIAVLDTYKPADAGDWTAEEIAFLETIADQLSVALENARLYETTQLRAERERMVSDITGRVRAAGDIDGILRTAVQEIRRALGTTHGVIRLGTETDLRPPARDYSGDVSIGEEEE
jgi:GAF domain-containing protein